MTTQLNQAIAADHIRELGENAARARRAGRRLRADIRAADVRGTRQLERRAGSIRVLG